MRRFILAAGLIVAGLMVGGAVQTVQAWVPYQVCFDFNTSWTSDYTPGWENSDYRHGDPPVGKMMEYVAGGVGGTGGMELIADSTPEDWMWWAAVNPIDVREYAMLKAYNPWVSVDYYDEGYLHDPDALNCAGQLYSVPSWVNPYIDGSEDWTDIQFGARFNQPAPNDNYYYVACGENMLGWQDTGVSRFGEGSPGWVNLKMQLHAADGFVHFYVNGVDKGTSYRNDYVDLISMGIYNMFEDPLSQWGDDKPSVIYDNFCFGSEAMVPEPGSAILLGLGLVGLAGVAYRRRKK